MADIKISELGAASAVNGTDIFPMTSSGVTVKATAQQIKNFMGVGNLADLDTTDKSSAVDAINEVNTKVSKTEDLISIVENGNTCTHTGGISKGQYVNWKGSLYTADSNISVGATFASSGGSKNLTAVSNGGLNKLNNILSSGTPEIISNERGVACKFPSGLMICIKTVTGSVNISVAWGALYTGSLNLGNWAVDFIETPGVSYTNVGTYAGMVCGIDTAPTNTKCGSISICRPDSGTRTISVSVIAIGKWK